MNPWQSEEQAITAALRHGCKWHGRSPSAHCCECGMVTFYLENPSEATSRGVNPAVLVEADERIVRAKQQEFIALMRQHRPIAAHAALAAHDMALLRLQDAGHHLPERG